MRALQSMRVSSPLESVFAENLGGGPPLHNNGRESEDDAARHGKQARPRGQAQGAPFFPWVGAFPAAWKGGQSS